MDSVEYLNVDVFRIRLVKVFKYWIQSWIKGFLIFMLILSDLRYLRSFQRVWDYVFYKFFLEINVFRGYKKGIYVNW